jgi:5-(carboxyamino)imidazole ribonucleotide mutase
MPSGIPVATMAIDGGKNAGLFALSILSVEDKMMTDKLKEFREKQARQVEEKNKKIQENL